MINKPVIIFEVELRMFGQGRMRTIAVPLDELTEDVNANLERIFHYGQNDFQARPHPSVSVGDVIRYKGDRYLVRPMSFRKLGEGECTEKFLTNSEEYIKALWQPFEEENNERENKNEVCHPPQRRRK